MTTNTQREFWVQKNPKQEWQTLKVPHPDYTDEVRIVANTFNEQSPALASAMAAQRTYPVTPVRVWS